MKYNPSKIESKWQKEWEFKKLYHTKDAVRGKKNFYCLTMFPYPSGDLHVGNWFPFIGTDVYGRFKRMQGYNLMVPIGFDAFGLPAENAAIERNLDPRVWTYDNIKKMKKQLRSIGTIFDWSREVITSEPDYYKWTQWIFLKLFEAGLAKKEKVLANWCPKDKTVLANEQVINGRCERCGELVIQKEIAQWMFKITDYADRLIGDLERVDWPEVTKIAQRNWIGRSEGTEIEFLVPNSKETIKVFTTRIDTLFGATYLVLAPEHPMVLKLTTDGNLDKVNKYLEEAKKKSELDRLYLEKEKTGVFTGGHIVNPINNEKIPVWVADYVIGWYGTGAVMAVPAHDDRDFEFVKRYGLPVKVVVRPEEKWDFEKRAFIGDGTLVDSGEFTGFKSADAREEITEKLAAKKLARRKINYRLHDWVISRQRYWGVPIPMVHCKKCGYQPVPETELPVKLPKLDDYKPTSDGRSPLAKAKEWVKTKCPHCSRDAERETDTMDTFVDSSWYFLRYADPKNQKEFASKNKLKVWLPVDMYIGGQEHATKHLLYARFITKVLHDSGYLEFGEPFISLRHQGLILGPDGQKMSKSRGNVVDPDEIVKKYGSDAVRMYLCFMGPYDQGGPWNPGGIIGVYRFLNRVWEMKEGAKKEKGIFEIQTIKESKEEILKKKSLRRLLHKTIKKITEDIENFRFNTAVSALMIQSNGILDEMEKWGHFVPKDIFENFILLLAPFAPHIAEEIWQNTLGHKKSIHLEKWPDYDKKLIAEELVSIVVQVGGKMRSVISLPADSGEEEAKKLALADEKVKKHLAGREVKRTIFVKNRLINFVI